MDNRKERRKAASKKSPYGVNSSKPRKSSTPAAAGPDELGCFFMASALAIYTNSEDDVKQRHVNALLQSDNAIIRKEDLNILHRTVLQRLNQENGISPDQVKDIVFLGISFLGAMPPEVFHGESASSVDETAPRPS